MKKILSLILIVLILYCGINLVLSPHKISKIKSNIDPLTLVNYNHALGDYKINLVTFNGFKVCDIIYNDLVDMTNAAKKDGITLKINNSYRTAEDQRDMFDTQRQTYLNQGYSYEKATYKAKETAQLPGYSEHQTGLAIDFSNEGHPDDNKKIWQWLKEKSYKYGFILRYPKGKEDITKITYEPWHFRYVGKKAAKEITKQNITLEEYLKGK